MAATPKPLRQQMKKEVHARRHYIEKEVQNPAVKHKEKGILNKIVKAGSKELSQYNLSKEKHPGKSMTSVMQKNKHATSHIRDQERKEAAKHMKKHGG